MRETGSDIMPLGKLARLIPVLAAALLFVTSAQAAVLQSSAYITGDTIRLGDVLTGALKAEREIAVRRAPAPGERRVLSVEEVVAVARAHGVTLTNPNGVSRIVVERGGKAVPRSLIDERLRAELVRRGLDGPYEIRLAGQGVDLAVPHDARVDVQVENFDYDADSGRFQAVLTTAAGSDRRHRNKVYGHAVAVTRVPVLAERLNRDAVIGESDIAWITMPENRVPQGAVTEASALIGKSPRRLLQPDRPVRDRDVRAPVIVKKGAAVTMVVRGRGLRLTALGRALEDGSKGDVIRVVNQDTHQTVQTTVVGSGQVQVGFQSASLAP